MRRSIRATTLIALALFTTLPALAAHPLQTDDTGTVGAGLMELENGLSRNAGSGLTEWQFQPQLTMGLSARTDLIVRPSWLSRRADGAAAVRGNGDTAVELKWRVLEAAPASLALRGGLVLATGRNGLGLPHGSTAAHAEIVASMVVAPLALHANLDYQRVPGDATLRHNLGRLGAALTWAASERLTWVGEATLASDTEPQRRTWPGTLLVGTIFTLVPGLDVDAGFQSSVRAARPSHGWLVGLTVRFKP